MLDPRTAIGEINERHGARWDVVARLPGGYSASGAHLLRDGDARAVLKLQPPGRTPERLGETQELIRAAIAAGWPTPAWLAAGMLAHGESYVVREFIDGRGPTALGEDELELLLDANRRQAGLRPATGADWSAYARREVFGSSAARGRMREHEETNALVERLASLTDRARDVVLPVSDVVHGDFTLLNTVIRAGRAYMVDAEFAGKGTRGYDLATLLVHAGTADLGASRVSLDRLRDECVRCVGADGLLVCVAARIIGLIDFGFSHWPHDLRSFVARCGRFLDRLDA